jgi:hypothetical protein
VASERGQKDGQAGSSETERLHALDVLSKRVHKSNKNGHVDKTRPILEHIQEWPAIPADGRILGSMFDDIYSSRLTTIIIPDS